MTSGTPFNTFSRHYHPDYDFKNTKERIGKRLDYVFYRHTPKLTCTASSVVFHDIIPDSNMSYSDHFGVLSTFSCLPSLTEYTETMAPTPDQLLHPNYTQISPSTVQEITSCLQLAIEKAHKDSHRLLVFTGLFVLLQILLYVLIIVLPTTLPHYWVILLVTLFGSTCMNIVSIAIPICMIVGFVFGGREERALVQFYQELKTFQNNMDGSMVAQ